MTLAREAGAKPVAAQGVLVVDKPSGPTSFRVVAEARKLFQQRSVGHAGTLDPMATGVLVLLLGEATKLSAYLLNADKKYLATVRFGWSTDTFDAEGTRVGPSLPIHELNERALVAAAKAELMRTNQIPPAHSAVKVSGRRSYALARTGHTVTLEARPVAVHKLELLEVGEDWARFLLEVSKGYYVRSFVRDLCERLGQPGHLSSLRRTQSGCFSIEEAVTWPPSPAPLPMTMATAARRAMSTGVLTDEGTVRARHGKTLELQHFERPPEHFPSAWFDAAGELVAIGEQRGRELRVKRGFRTAT